MSGPNLTASPAAIQAHLNVLCRDIGTRVAASDAESRAADYVADYLGGLGLQDVTQQPFPFTEWGFEVAELEVNEGDGWRAVQCLPFVNSPSTPPEGLEAEVVYVASAEAADLEGRDLEDRILLVWGSFGETTDRLERLQASGAAAVLWVDDRLPVSWPASMGTPYDWRDLLQRPSACLPYWDAWRLACAERPRARLRLRVWRREGESVNVFADLPGSGDEMVHIGGHVDSVIVGTGADDDASGVAVTLEVARLLSELDEQPQRTIRFCGFGAEEQLSEGSRRYVLAHRDQVDHTRLMINLDSVGSALGHNEARIVGPPELTAAVRQLVALPAPTEVPGIVRQTPLVRRSRGEGASSVGGPQARRLEGPNGVGGVAQQLPRDREAVSAYSCQVLEQVSPYSDMFAFNIFGVPSVWLYRVNMPNMRYFHHSALDDLDVISPHQIALTATLTAHLTHHAACCEPTWRREIRPPHSTKLAEYANVFYAL